MEEALSTTLFDRGRDGLTPTKAAEDLMPVAEEIEEAMTRFASEAEGLERQVSGLIRIGAAASAVSRGGAYRAVAHATSGPCLQQNLVCVMES